MYILSGVVSKHALCPVRCGVLPGAVFYQVLCATRYCSYCVLPGVVHVVSYQVLRVLCPAWCCVPPLMSCQVLCLTTYYYLCPAWCGEQPRQVLCLAACCFPSCMLCPALCLKYIHLSNMLLYQLTM